MTETDVDQESFERSSGNPYSPPTTTQQGQPQVRPERWKTSVVGASIEILHTLVTLAGLLFGLGLFVAGYAQESFARIALGILIIIIACVIGTGPVARAVRRLSD